MNLYELRGVRVYPMTEENIRARALILAEKFKFTKRRKKKCEKGFELLSELGVTLSVIDDEEWILDLTKGNFDPVTRTIAVPNVIYENACKGEQEALFVMFHELGHLFLMHRPLLHASSSEPTMIEDAEWQADTFAEAILQNMGFTTKQLSFDFYM